MQHALFYQQPREIPAMRYVRDVTAKVWAIWEWLVLVQVF